MEKRVDDAIRVIFNLIRHKINESEKLRLIGDQVTHRQGAVIGIIDEAGDKPVFQKDIERILRIRRSTATSMLKDMEKQGLIIRQAVDNDMRLKKLILTDKAKHYSQLIKEERSVIEECLVQGFSEQEKTELMNYLDRIKDNLTNKRRQK